MKKTLPIILLLIAMLWPGDVCGSPGPDARSVGPLRTRIAERRAARNEVDVEPAGLFTRRSRPTAPQPQREPMPAYLVGISSNGSGTCGTIIDDDLVLSCSHGKTAGSITCTFADGSKASAEIVARDAAADVCLLRVEIPATCQKLEVADYAPQAGESVTYLGRGGGYTARKGVVQVLRESWIQSSGTAYPGDSGGAIRNSDGELAGVIHHRGSGVYGTHATFLREWITKVCPCPPDLPPQPNVDPDEADPVPPKKPRRQRKPKEPKPGATITPTEPPNEKPADIKPDTPKAVPAAPARPAVDDDDGNPIIAAAIKYGLPVAATALGVTMPPAMVGFAGYGAWLAISRWRKQRKAKASTAKEEQPNKARTFPGIGSIPRDMEEGKQLLQLCQLEGREPLSDAIIGRFAIDEIETACESLPDGPERDFFTGLRRRLMDKFNDVAPITTRI